MAEGSGPCVERADGPDGGRGGVVRARTLREKVEEKSNFGALFQIQIARDLWSRDDKMLAYMQAARPMKKACVLECPWGSIAVWKAIKTFHLVLFCMYSLGRQGAPVPCILF